MLKYYLPEKVDGVTYSIDMLRLTFDTGANAQAFSDWIAHLSAFDDTIDVKYFPNFSPFKYRHLWVFEVDMNGDKISWSIGFSLGSETTKGFFEFNPNKCASDRAFERFFEGYSRYVVISEIKRYDLAMDIPVERWRCHMHKDNRKYEMLLDKSKTEYLGRRSNYGFCKLYDKTVESDLNYPLTRLEVTCEPNKDVKVPEVKISKEQMEIVDTSNLTPTDKVIFELARRVDDAHLYIRDLDRRKRKKIEKLLASTQESFQMQLDVVHTLVERMQKFVVIQEI